MMSTMAPPATPAVAPQGPPPSLPLRFMATGLLVFVGALWGLITLVPPLVAGTTLAGPVLAVIHALALGWLTMVAMGASYQLMPVALGIDLHSQAWAKASYWWLTVGTAGLVGGFIHFRSALMLGAGGVIAIAAGLFLLNAALSLRQVRTWSPTGIAMAGAYTMLGAVVSLGVAMLADLQAGFSAGLVVNGPPAHAFLALFGWLLPLIVGVSYKLLPMFGLIHGHDETVARWVLPVGLAATAATAMALLLASPGWPLFAGIETLCLIAFVIDTRRMMARRLRRQPDIGLRFVTAGLLWLCLTTTAGMWAAATLPLPMPAPRFWLLLGVWTLLGGLSQVVLGYLHKILPFLRWLHRYADQATRGPAPRTADLLDAGAARIGWWAWQVSLAALGVALGSGASAVVRLSVLATAASGTWIAFHLLRVLRK